MVAVVQQPGAPRRERIDRIELEHFDPSLRQPLEEGLRGADSTDAVVDEVHLDTARLLLQQQIGELPASLRQSGAGGVLVEGVARGSRAARNGLRQGDVVVAATSGDFDDLPGFRASFTLEYQHLPSEVRFAIEDVIEGRATAP